MRWEGSDDELSQDALFAQFSAIDAVIRQVGADNVILSLNVTPERLAEGLQEGFADISKQPALENYVFPAFQAAGFAQERGVQVVGVADEDGHSVDGIKDLADDAKVIIHIESARAFGNDGQSHALFGYTVEDSMQGDGRLERWFNAFGFVPDQSADLARNPFLNDFAHTVHIDALNLTSEEQKNLTRWTEEKSHSGSSKKLASSFSMVKEPENVRLSVNAPDSVSDATPQLIKDAVILKGIEANRGALTPEEEALKADIQGRFDAAVSDGTTSPQVTHISNAM